jgi:hypothetical protein
VPCLAQISDGASFADHHVRVSSCAAKKHDVN